MTPACKNPSRAAFSFIELLIVVALLVLLTTMYWGGKSTPRSREQKRLAACAQNLQHLFIAMQIYANEAGERFPAITKARTSEDALDLLVPKYTVDTSIFICPGTKDPPLASGESLLKGKVSYAYFMGRSAAHPEEPLMSDRLVDVLPKSPGQNGFSPDGKGSGNNHGKFGGNFLYCDGHTDQVGSRLPFALSAAPGQALLNPKP